MDFPILGIALMLTHTVAYEADLPPAGRVVVAEEEAQLEVDMSSERLRRRFREDFDGRMEWIMGISRLRSIPVLTVRTDEDCGQGIKLCC